MNTGSENKVLMICGVVHCETNIYNYNFYSFISRLLGSSSVFLFSVSLFFHTEGLNDVILYHQPDDKKKNRGFCFLEYEDHKTAAQARRRLMSGKVKVWGNVVTVEWADPIEDPDPEVMAKVSGSDGGGNVVDVKRLKLICAIFRRVSLLYVVCHRSRCYLCETWQVL